MEDKQTILQRFKSRCGIVTNKDLMKEIMALQDDLDAAADSLIAKNDALIALVGQLNATIASTNTALPVAVSAVIAKLTAEAGKDDAVLHPAPPTP